MTPNDLLPRVARGVRSVVPDAPTDMLLDDIAWTAARYVAEAKLMTREMRLDLQACVPDYLLDECPGPELRWHGLAAAWVNGREFVSRGSVPTLEACYAGEDAVVWSQEYHTITLRPLPSQDLPGGLQLRMVVTLDPQRLETLPAFLADPEHHDALVAGAVARALGDLMPRAAAPFEARYSAHLNRAVTRRLLGHGDGDALRMTARGFIAR